MIIASPIAMSLAALIPIAIKASLMLMVFGVGIKASMSDTLFLFRRPGQLARAFLAMDIAVPLVAVGLSLVFPLEAPVKIALVTMSLAPLPPTFSKKPLKAGGSVSYAVGLFIAITLIAVVFVPLALMVLMQVFGMPLAMSAASVWELVLWALLVPMLAGLVIHHIWPSFGDRVAEPLAKAGSILFLIVFIAILVKVWPAMISLIGNGTVLVMIVLAVIAIAVGHALGGPAPGDRTTLALASASRHPAIAIAIASANFPDQKLAPAAVVLYLIVSGLASAPYLKLVGRRRASGIGEMRARPV